MILAMIKMATRLRLAGYRHRCESREATQHVFCGDRHGSNLVQEKKKNSLSSFSVAFYKKQTRDVTGKMKAVNSA